MVGAVNGLNDPLKDSEIQLRSFQESNQGRQTLPLCQRDKGSGFDDIFVLITKENKVFL